MPLISALAFSLNSYGFAGAGAGDLIIDYLIQAGGGAGGSNYGGGGGAGGLRLGASIPVEAGVEYTISVGGGGSVVPASPSAGNNGVGSFIEGGTLSHIGSNGGGGGGSYNLDTEHNSRSGGCGGGSGFEYPTGTFGPRSKSLFLNSANGHSGSVTSENVFRGSSIQGSDGGEGGHAPGVWAGTGGGGGTLQIGQDAKQNHPSPNKGGHGGNGLTSTIDGNSTAYGGGGGGSISTSPQPGTNEAGGAGGGGAGAAAPNGGVAGTTNSGGGGGGGGNGTAGGAGGSGVVIIRTAQTAKAVTGSPTETTDGGFNIYKFTGTGSITF